jgi:hypothetical protein
LDKHPLAGQTVILKCKEDPDKLNGKEFVIEDWWMNVSGKSWMFAAGNPACLKYAIRSAIAELPINNKVIYGKIGSFGHLIHESELGEVVNSLTIEFLVSDRVEVVSGMFDGVKGRVTSIDNENKTIEIGKGVCVGFGMAINLEKCRKDDIDGLLDKLKGGKI